MRSSPFDVRSIVTPAVGRAAFPALLMDEGRISRSDLGSRAAACRTPGCRAGRGLRDPRPGRRGHLLYRAGGSRRPGAGGPVGDGDQRARHPAGAGKARTASLRGGARGRQPVPHLRHLPSVRPRDRARSGVRLRKANPPGRGHANGAGRSAGALLPEAARARRAGGPPERRAAGAAAGGGTHRAAERLDRRRALRPHPGARRRSRRQRRAHRVRRRRHDDPLSHLRRARARADAARRGVAADPATGSRSWPAPTSPCATVRRMARSTSTSTAAQSTSACRRCRPCRARRS